MDKASNDACITIKVVDGCQGWLAGVASVFIKREDRDPTLSELDQEANKARDAHTKEHDMLRSHFREEADIKLNYEEYWTAVHSLLNDLEYNSDWTPYYRWHQNPSWPAKSKEPTSKGNPVDLTRPIQSATDMTKRKEKTDLRQTNAVSVRSSPPLSTQPSFLSTVSQAQQESTVERTQFQPKESLSKTDTHLQSTSITGMSEQGRGKTKAVAKRSAVSTSNAKDAVSKPMTEAAAETANKASSQPPTRQNSARAFKDLMNASGTDRAVQSKSSPPPASTTTMSNQSVHSKRGLKDARTPEKRRIPVRPSFVRQDSNASSMSFDKHELPDNMPKSTQPLPSGPSIKGKSLFKEFQAKSSPTLSQQPAAAPTNQQTLDNDPPRVPSSQLSDNFDDYLKDMFGDLDDRTHRLFKLSMLHASLLTLQNTPGNDHVAPSLYSQINTNERNSRIVNKSLEAVVDAYNNGDDSSKTKTAEHCKLLDKQEKERQESLEGVIEKLNNDKRDKAKLVSELDGMKAKLMKEKEDIDKEEEDRLSKYVQQKEQNKHNGEERRKRKRDAEKEDHIDIDMLL